MWLNTISFPDDAITFSGSRSFSDMAPPLPPPPRGQFHICLSSCCSNDPETQAIYRKSGDSPCGRLDQRLRRRCPEKMEEGCRSASVPVATSSFHYNRINSKRDDADSGIGPWKIPRVFPKFSTLKHLLFSCLEHLQLTFKSTTLSHCIISTHAIQTDSATLLGRHLWRLRQFLISRIGTALTDGLRVKKIPLTTMSRLKS